MVCSRPASPTEAAKSKIRFHREMSQLSAFERGVPGLSALSSGFVRQIEVRGGDGRLWGGSCLLDVMNYRAADLGGWVLGESL